jgi:hypothetical protein
LFDLWGLTEFMASFQNGDPFGQEGL